MTSLLSVNNALSSAKSVPFQDRWHDTGITYHGQRVLVNHTDGTMAYEADGARLVSLPEADEERIVDLIVDTWYAQEGLMVATGEVH